MRADDQFIIILELISLLIAGLALATSFFCAKKTRELKRGRELLLTQIEEQEQDFNNIYNQIHDNIGQVLSLAKWNLQTVEAGLPQEANEKISHANQLISKAITDLRDLSKNHATKYRDCTVDRCAASV
jgi:signal transduction histidine kinase